MGQTVYAKAKKRAVDGKIPPPEERLRLAKLGAVALPISLFWFAWTARRSVHWIVPILAGIPFGFGNIMLFVSHL